MDWDDEYDNGYDDMNHASQRNYSMSDNGSPEGGFDPTDIVNPVSAYFFLSDDAQDEISGGKKNNMKCKSCGHRFAGESYESCPECFSVNTEEIIAGIDCEEEVAEDANIRCHSCGHTFVGEVYDRCPECFSSDTEKVTDEKEQEYW